MLYSRDGHAQLLVGAFLNDDATTIEDYRRFVIEDHYAGADIGYAPVRGNWFVVSGSSATASSTSASALPAAAGLINSWAMIYPKAEAALL